MCMSGVWIGNWIYWTLTDRKYSTNSYSAIANSHNPQLLQHERSLHSLLYLHRLSPINGFQYRSFLNFLVHVLTGRRLIQNLLIALTPRLAAISHQPPTLLIAILILSCNCCCSLLYSLGTDNTENTSPNSSVVASCSYSTDSVENTASQFLSCCVLRIC
jgi:hypothetical protein